ncbi:hypothetical protein ACFQBQ_02305 [Granulicella cerasi]|uniref:Uncharacterized protein n=1 Tax=Granulicella cerasi TaxID=741063 RepID=A0ABW1Z8E9_9BACT|nr:hypothetical protein [Granulicella cerasi]
MKTLLRTIDHVRNKPDPKKLPKLDTSRKIANALKINDDLLCRRALEQAQAETGAPYDLFGRSLKRKHMVAMISALYPAALSDGDREMLNAYLWPDGGTHYADELLRGGAR